MRRILASNGQLGTTSDKLQEVTALAKSKLAHDRQEVLYALAVHVESMVGLDGVGQSYHIISLCVHTSCEEKLTFKRPILLDLSKQHDQLIRSKGPEGREWEDLRETGLECIRLFLDTAAEGKVNHLVDVFAHVEDGDAGVGAVGDEFNVGIAGEGEVEGKVVDRGSVNGNLPGAGKLLGPRETTLSNSLLLDLILPKEKQRLGESLVNSLNRSERWRNSRITAHASPEEGRVERDVDNPRVEHGASNKLAQDGEETENLLAALRLRSLRTEWSREETLLSKGVLAVLVLLVLPPKLEFLLCERTRNVGVKLEGRSQSGTDFLKVLNFENAWEMAIKFHDLDGGFQDPATGDPNLLPLETSKVGTIVITAILARVSRSLRVLPTSH